MRKFVPPALVAALLLAPIAAHATEFHEILHGKTGVSSIGDTDELYILPGGGSTPDKVLGSKFLRPGNLAGSSGAIQTNNGSGSFGSIAPGSGVAAFLATPAGAVPASWLASLPANSLLGNPTGSSAVPTTITIPNCGDSGGNHLNYSSGTISCGTSTSAPGGTGDVVGPGSSVSGNAASFSGTTGKQIADSGKALPSGAIVGTTDAQTLPNKTLISPTIAAIGNLTGNGLVRTSGGTGILGIAGAGTDYAPPTSGSSGDIQTSNGSGGFGTAITPASGIATFLATPSGANLASALTTALPVSKGGTNATAAGGTALDNITGFAFTGLVKRTGAGAYAAAIAGTDYAAAPGGTANTPLFNNGSGGFTNGTRSGNTTALVTKDASTPATNDCAKWDASGNLTTAGAACGAGGGSVSTTDGTTSVTTSTLSFDPVVFDVVDSGSGTATIKQVTTVNSQSGTSYTVIASDANKTVRTTNASAVTLNLTAAASLGSGFGFYVECDGAGGCVIDPASSETIDGAATLALAQGGKAFVQTDGTGWRGAVLSPLDPRNASNLNSGKVPNAQGGAGTLTGFLRATSGVVAAATTSGSGTTLGTVSGTPTTGNCVSWSSGNLVDAGGPCTTGGGGGTVSSGTANQIARYASTGTTVSGDSGLTDDGLILTATQALALSGTLTPTALSGNVNDYNPSNLATALALRLDGGAADRTITGLAGGVDGRIITVTNIGGTNKLILSNADSGSSAANRFQLSSNVELPPNTSLALRYDGTSSLWRPWSRALANSGVTAGSYTSANITVGADGRVTAASNGTASGGGVIELTAGNGTITSSAVYLGQSQVATTFGAARPFIATKSMTLRGMRCWVNGGPGSGNVITATATLGAGGSSTGVDQTSLQQVQLSGTTNGSSTLADADLTLSAGDVLGIHFAATSGSIAGFGVVCGWNWS